MELRLRGAAAAVSGNAQGRDVIDILTADHLEVTALLREITASPDPETRRDLADIVITELVRHSVAEEMYVPGGARAPARRPSGC